LSALPRPTRRRRWAFRPAGAGRRKVSLSAALKSAEVSQGVAAERRAALVVRRVGVAGASLIPGAGLAVSAAKTTRSGVAMSAGDWWSRVVVTLSMVTLSYGEGSGAYGGSRSWPGHEESNLVASPAAPLRPAAARKGLGSGVMRPKETRS